MKRLPVTYETFAHGEWSCAVSLATQERPDGTLEQRCIAIGSRLIPGKPAVWIYPREPRVFATPALAVAKLRDAIDAFVSAEVVP